MSLPAGSKIGSYEIVVSIGAGGMGEVYRAHDAKLGRDVAIKILPANVANDADRLGRFEREARTLASLNHPNIAQVYGFEDGALIMELLEGETLRDRLRNAALSTRKAIEYATQIARGLAAAHDRGIIHRDLKPENVFLLKDGQVKLLDFGLARESEAPAPTGATETVPAVAGTDPGTVLGTVAYMSPEQVRADVIDVRTDLFSLGAVLYEMLTGERAFRRDTTAETMTAILREEPPELSSRADISPALDRIVRHAIEKNPVERFQTARDIAFALDSLSGSASTPSLGTSTRPSVSRERLAWLVATAGLAAAVLWLGLGRGGAAGASPSPSYQIDLALPDEVRTADGINPVFRLGLSNDGSTVAYAGVDPAGQRHTWIISLSNGSVRALDDAGSQPTFSPDGLQLAVTVRQPGGAITKRLDLVGGHVEALAPFSGFKAWSPAGIMLFTGLGVDSKSLALSAGAEPKALDHNYGVTSFLPDGTRFLGGGFVSGVEPDAVFVASVDSAERTRLIEGAAAAWYSSGTVAFVKDNTVLVQRVDERTMTLAGSPATLTEGVDQATTGGLAIAGSPSGTLVLQRPQQRGRSQLKWFRRDGVAESTVGEAADYSNAELSPDGRRLLVSITDPRISTRDLFIVDLLRGVRQRLTFDPSDERSGVWSSDGQRVFYRSKGMDLYVRQSNFTGGEDPLVIDGVSKDPYSVSADGKQLIYRKSGVNNSNDVMLVPLDGKSASTPLRATPFDENGGSFSPDGASIVYQSDESGQMEVYVLALMGGGRVQLSSTGGAFARWSRTGKEIFYLSPDRVLMSVPVRGSGSNFQAGTPQKLFQLDAPSGGGVPYDVTADGQRILAIASIEVTSKPRLTAIINWPARLP